MGNAAGCCGSKEDQQFNSDMDSMRITVKDPLKVKDQYANVDEGEESDDENEKRFKKYKLDRAASIAAIPKAPPVTQALIRELMKKNLKARMAPPPPFSKAMGVPPPPVSGVKPPLHVKGARVSAVIPSAPVFAPKRPVVVT